jgi:hypothetical protein
MSASSAAAPALRGQRERAVREEVREELQSVPGLEEGAVAGSEIFAGTARSAGQVSGLALQPGFRRWPAVDAAGLESRRIGVKFEFSKPERPRSSSEIRVSDVMMTGRGGETCR